MVHLAKRASWMSCFLQYPGYTHSSGLVLYQEDCWKTCTTLSYYLIWLVMDLISHHLIWLVMDLISHHLICHFNKVQNKYSQPSLCLHSHCIMLYSWGWSCLRFSVHMAHMRKGPDDIHYLLLKHLSLMTISHLLSICCILYCNYISILIVRRHSHSSAIWSP